MVLFGGLRAVLGRSGRGSNSLFGGARSAHAAIGSASQWFLIQGPETGLAAFTHAPLTGPMALVQGPAPGGFGGIRVPPWPIAVHVTAAAPIDCAIAALCALAIASITHWPKPSAKDWLCAPAVTVTMQPPTVGTAPIATPAATKDAVAEPALFASEAPMPSAVQATDDAPTLTASAAAAPAAAVVHVADPKEPPAWLEPEAVQITLETPVPAASAALAPVAEQATVAAPAIGPGPIPVADAEQVTVDAPTV